MQHDIFRTRIAYLATTLAIAGVSLGCAGAIGPEFDGGDEDSSGSVVFDSPAAQEPPIDFATPWWCAYPEGPYGVEKGDVVPPDLEWQGYRPGDSEPSTISIREMYDCDGNKGINALLVSTSKILCGACVQEAEEVEEHAETIYGPKGIEMIILLGKGAKSEPATVDSAALWKSEYNLESAYVAADPDWSFAPSLPTPTPLNTVVDPRTMKVVHIRMGYSPSFSQLVNLADANAAAKP